MREFSQILILNPTIIIFICTIFFLVLKKNYKYSFEIFAIVVPIISAISLICHKNIEILPIAGIIDITIDYQDANKLIALAFLFALLIGNLYSLQKRKYKELVYGSLYCASTIFYILAGDFISFFISIEFMLLFSLLLIFAPCDALSFKNGKEYLFTHMISSGMIIISIAYIISKTGSSQIMNLIDFANQGIAETFICYLMATGFLINIASFPFSAWMLNSYSNANGSSFIYLMNFTTKATIFLMLKIFSAFIFLKFFAVGMILYGGLRGIFENNLKRLLCYINIASIGFVILAIADNKNDVIFPLIFLYIWISILCQNLLIIPILLLENFKKIKNCSDLKRLSDPGIVIIFAIAILIMINFPFFMSFSIKSAIFKAIDQNLSYYMSLLLNILLIMAFPIKDYFFVKEKINLKLTNIHQIIFWIFIIMISFLLIFVAYELDHYLYDIIKQFLIIIFGLILSIFLKIVRSNSDSNSDLISFLYKFFEKINFRQLDYIKKFKPKLAIPEIPNLNNNSQQTAVFLVFSMLIIMIITLTY